VKHADWHTRFSHSVIIELYMAYLWNATSNRLNLSLYTSQAVTWDSSCGHIKNSYVVVTVCDDSSWFSALWQRCAFPAACCWLVYATYVHVTSFDSKFFRLQLIDITDIENSHFTETLHCLSQIIPILYGEKSSVGIANKKWMILQNKLF
jgi:hypothetical protein